MQDDNAKFLPSLRQFFPIMAQVPVAPLDPDVQAAINPAPRQQDPQLIAQPDALPAAQPDAQPAAQLAAQPATPFVYTFCTLISSNFLR